MHLENIIEIQGFVDAVGKFLPKKVAVVSLGGRITNHHIVLPPYSFQYLEDAEKKQNNWLTKNYHGIRWVVGEISIQDMEKNLRQIGHESHVIYTRGIEKVKYLEFVTSRGIRNLENISPPFRHPILTHRYCEFHAAERNNSLSCALQNSLYLRDWIKRNKKVVDAAFINVCDVKIPTRISMVTDSEASPEEGYDTVD